mmetsp:Transcript_45343/g.144115  ORF Transcript_45343/g.144115 Transcript_45343/m.144115 type:complete len:375 (-) Transcript_45343:29-1153(-)
MGEVVERAPPLAELRERAGAKAAALDPELCRRKGAVELLLVEVGVREARSRLARRPLGHVQVGARLGAEQEHHRGGVVAPRHDLVDHVERAPVLAQIHRQYHHGQEIAGGGALDRPARRVREVGDRAGHVLRVAREEHGERVGPAYRGRPHHRAQRAVRQLVAAVKRLVGAEKVERVADGVPSRQRRRRRPRQAGEAAVDEARVAGEEHRDAVGRTLERGGGSDDLPQLAVREAAVRRERAMARHLGRADEKDLLAEDVAPDQRRRRLSRHRRQVEVGQPGRACGSASPRLVDQRREDVASIEDVPALAELRLAPAPRRRGEAHLDALSNVRRRRRRPDHLSARGVLEPEPAALGGDEADVGVVQLVAGPVAAR